ncbi:MAG TPA: LytR C-terminal domain-containing protein [Pseudonocardia sp.]
MTSPASSGGPSPLRIGGLALIGIGIIAGVVGLATFATGGGGSGSDQQAAPPPLSTQVSITPEPSAPPVPQAAPTPAAPPPAAPASTSQAAVPVPSFTPAPTGAPGGNASSSQDGVTSGGTSRTGAVRAPLRVYNNSTITGLAARAAADFRNAGWQVEEVGNYPSGIIPTSTVYYRPGTGEQQAAQALADQFGLRAEARFSGLDEASPGLIVIATNDYQGR